MFGQGGGGPSVYMDFLKEHGPGIHHVMLETTDNYKETLAMADRVSGGRPPVLSTYFQDGTPICFYADMLKEIGLDVPQAARIAQALRDRGIPLPPSIYTLEQLTDALLAAGKEAGVC